MIKRPMLAGTCEDIHSLTYPLLATPKLDGFRCITMSAQRGGDRCRPQSRTFKPIGNRFVTDWLAKYVPAGLDGELVVINELGKVIKFNLLSGMLRNGAGHPNFVFQVFDMFMEGVKDRPYRERMRRLEALRLPRGRVDKILPVEVVNAEELQAVMEEHAKDGYSGTMTRLPDSPYKEGSSTLKQEYWLEIQRR